MSKSKKQKNISKSKRIRDLKKEIVTNDEIYKKNKEKRNIQIQIGLYRKGFPQSTGMYDTFLEKMESEVKIINLMIDSEYKVVNPTFEFQISLEWQKLQLEKCKKEKEEIESNVKTIKAKVEEVEKEIDTQNARIEERRKQILCDLKELKYDIKEFDKPNYIG